MKDSKHRRKSKNQQNQQTKQQQQNHTITSDQQRFLGISSNSYPNEHKTILHSSDISGQRSKKDHHHSHNNHHKATKTNVIAVKSIATADHLKLHHQNQKDNPLQTPSKDSSTNALMTQANVIENLSVGISAADAKTANQANGGTNYKDRMSRFSSEHPRTSDRYMAPNLWHKNELKLGEKQVQINSLKAQKKQAKQQQQQQQQQLEQQQQQHHDNENTNNARIGTVLITTTNAHSAAKGAAERGGRINDQYTPHLEKHKLHEKQFNFAEAEDHQQHSQDQSSAGINVNASSNKTSKVILAQSGKMKRFKRQRISSAEGGGGGSGSQLHNQHQHHHHQYNHNHNANAHHHKNHHYQLQKEPTNDGPYSVQIIDQGVQQQPPTHHIAAISGPAVVDYHQNANNTSTLSTTKNHHQAAESPKPVYQQYSKQYGGGGSHYQNHLQKQRGSSGGRGGVVIPSSPPDSSTCEMLNLLTNTTIHLQSEADRLRAAKTSNTANAPGSGMVAGVSSFSRKSRDSNKYLKKSSIQQTSTNNATVCVPNTGGANYSKSGAINSHRSHQLTTTQSNTTNTTSNNQGGICRRSSGLQQEDADGYGDGCDNDCVRDDLDDEGDCENGASIDQHILKSSGETAMFIIHHNNKNNNQAQQQNHLHHRSLKVQHQQSQQRHEGRAGGGGPQKKSDHHGNHPVVFKQKYPQTRIKTDQPLQKSAQRKSQLEYKKSTIQPQPPQTSSQYQPQQQTQGSAYSMTAQSFGPGPAANSHTNSRKVGGAQQQPQQRSGGLLTATTTTTTTAKTASKSVKRKPVSALEDADYDRLFPPATSSSQKQVIADARNSNNMTTTAGIAASPATMNFIGPSTQAELVSETIDGQQPAASAIDYYPPTTTQTTSKKIKIEQSSRAGTGVTMPQIAQTPQVTINGNGSSTKQTQQQQLLQQQSNMSRLSSQKQPSYSKGGFMALNTSSENNTTKQSNKLRQPSAKFRGSAKTQHQHNFDLKESSLFAVKKISQQTQQNSQMPSQPISSQFTIQSPPNSHQTHERKPLFEHGRTSRTKNGRSSIYPALTAHQNGNTHGAGGVSTTCVVPPSAGVMDISVDGGGRTGPNGLKAGNATNNNNKTTISASDIPPPQKNNSIATNKTVPPADTSSSLMPSLNGTGTTNGVEQQQSNKSTAIQTNSMSAQPSQQQKSAAPKFLPAGSIKMQQAVKASNGVGKKTHGGLTNGERGTAFSLLNNNYQHSENSQSVKNLHDVAGQAGAPGGAYVRRTAAAAAKQYDGAWNAASAGNKSFPLKMQQQNHFLNGRLLLERKRHCLESSSEESSDGEDNGETETDDQRQTTSMIMQDEAINSSQDNKTSVTAGQSIRNPTETGTGASPDSKPITANTNGCHQQSLPPITSAVANTEDKKQKQRGSRKTNNKGGNKLIFNLMYTVYPLVKRVAKQLNFQTRTEDIQLIPPAHGSEEYYFRQSGCHQPQGPPPDFDVSWIDNGIQPDALKNVKCYQRISQFPGITCISNKKKLAMGLMRMYKLYPDQYDFFPQTYLLPVEYNEFKQQFKKDSSAAKKESRETETYIIKPENLCQGRGIYLVKDPSDVEQTDNCVAQRYITNPFLIDDLKFDLRLYVLLMGVNPLRIFLFKDGLVRLATEPYVKPTENNIGNLFMHLTNYAINKKNKQFQQNAAEDSSEDLDDDGTHKRSLKSLIYTLKCMGKPYRKLKEGIDELLVKTLIVAQPSLSHIYKSCQPDDLENQLCFQILGIDVMIDEACKPWLIEVNQSPSFKADSGLDKRIKEKLVSDTVKLLNLSTKRKQKWIIQSKKVIQQRMVTGKKVKLTAEEKEEKIKEHMRERDEFEKANLGQFRMIYPIENADKMAKYEELIQASQESWEEFNYGKKRRFQGLPAHAQNTTANAGAKQESTKDMSALDAGAAVSTSDATAEKPIWRNGQIINYVPAWERKFQKSLQQKQARMNSLQSQNTQDLKQNQQNQAQAATAVLSARQNQDPPSARGGGGGAQNNSNPFRQSNTVVKDLK